MLQFKKDFDEGNIGTGFGILAAMFADATDKNNREGANYIMNVKDSIAFFQEMYYFNAAQLHDYVVAENLELTYGTPKYLIYRDNEHTHYIVEQDVGKYIICS